MQGHNKYAKKTTDARPDPLNKSNKTNAAINSLSIFNYIVLLIEINCLCRFTGTNIINININNNLNINLNINLVSIFE